MFPFVLRPFSFTFRSKSLFKICEELDGSHSSENLELPGTYRRTIEEPEKFSVKSKRAVLNFKIFLRLFDKEHSNDQRLKFKRGKSLKQTKSFLIKLIKKIQFDKDQIHRGWISAKSKFHFLANQSYLINFFLSLDWTRSKIQLVPFKHFTTLSGPFILEPLF